MRKEFGGMGFRHLHGFNLAMLGKQGCNLLTNQDTIIARIFKARYFPDSDFLGARLGHNPSFIWRSIYTSRAIVRGGLRWCIGDGRRINIWHEPWLRDDANSYVTSPIIQGMVHYIVADLMNSTNHTWQWDTIESIFNSRDRGEISKIATRYMVGEDMHVWKFSTHGSYTVKSAYRYAMDTLINNEEYKKPGDWMQIWRMKIPQRVKIFVWRIVRGCLPTRDRLQQKRVQCTDLCPHCESTYENEWHLFVSCCKAREVWLQAGLWDVVNNLSTSAVGFSELIFSALTVLEGAKKQDFVMMVWCLWRQQNDKVWEEQQHLVQVSIQACKTFSASMV
jgi:hypothetical protein